MSDLFDRLDAKRPPAEEKTAQPDPAQKLLDWLLQCGKSTVYTRDILIYGPHSLRNRESMLKSTEVLVRHGWLVPAKTNPRNKRERQWHIVHKSVVHPQLAK